MSIQSFEYRSTSTGLGDISTVIPNTDTYIVKVNSTAPSIINGGGESAIITLVKVNSTTKYTSNAGDRGLTIEVPATAGDTITVHTSSANAVDNAINAVKITVAISEGNL